MALAIVMEGNSGTGGGGNGTTTTKTIPAAHARAHCSKIDQFYTVFRTFQLAFEVLLFAFHMLLLMLLRFDVPMHPIIAVISAVWSIIRLAIFGIFRCIPNDPCGCLGQDQKVGWLTLCFTMGLSFNVGFGWVLSSIPAEKSSQYLCSGYYVFGIGPVIGHPLGLPLGVVMIIYGTLILGPIYIIQLYGQFVITKTKQHDQNPGMSLATTLVSICKAPKTSLFVRNVQLAIEVLIFAFHFCIFAIPLSSTRHYDYDASRYLLTIWGLVRLVVFLILWFAPNDPSCGWLRFGQSLKLAWRTCCFTLGLFINLVLGIYVYGFIEERTSKYTCTNNLGSVMSGVQLQPNYYFYRSLGVVMIIYGTLVLGLVYVLHLFQLFSNTTNGQQGKILKKVNETKA